MQSTKHLQDAKYKPDVYFPNILSPFFRSPLTDVFGSIINHQQYGKCARFEMNMMECMEAYGYDKGKVKCADLIEDFNECHNMTKQFLRHMAMEAERERQYKAGEVKEKYAPPPHPNAY
ncbi:NADH dehydrogenase [ubiquinone] iron-sulfur protein 5 [Sitodiplosis mosellana]|uniref:NADH dehydrogenase [ubiquinone] iron-sulfur protein 5 n=1 Tax=Sitodiplosis mosellana TaxID=263140 RepID=UPI002444A01E|nr:NADH dehydrogenase [ubiquinone] iron-sulfur protein 5 [Sitodiplosis mosellana]